jgi:hypothetical protein
MGGLTTVQLLIIELHIKYIYNMKEAGSYNVKKIDIFFMRSSAKV